MYYNQNDFGHVPYPAKGYESATVKSGGCGVCCAAMVVEGLLGISFPPESAAALAREAGARVSGGTRMDILGDALCGRFGLAMATASDTAALTACLKAGGWAVANVGGDRPGYVGLFSSGGHYVAVRGQAADGRLMVWDPGFYSGKLEKPGRRGRAEVRGDDILVQAEELDTDCQNRSPRYYLFAGRVGAAPEAGAAQPEPSAWAAEAWGRAVAAGILDGTNPQGGLTREQLAVVLLRLGLLEG